MRLYERSLFRPILEKLSGQEAIFIFGARQCGKTTLLKQLMKEVGEENSLYIDIEYPEMLSLFNQGFDEVLRYLRYNRKKSDSLCYVFIDEIQYVTDFSQTVKLFVDHHSAEFKLIMTGSSSALIKYHFRESLVGRKVTYDLYPLSFKEFLRFKELDKLARTIEEAPEAIPVDQYIVLERMSEEYMIFGGYPKVVLSERTEDKQEILADIASSYILKDIKDLFKIEKIENLNHLVRNLAVNIGKEINISSLATEVGLHRETTDNYLRILEECYIIRRLKPFHGNLNKELKKIPKVYFVDHGIRNLLINNFNRLSSRVDKGELFENLVFLNLFHKKDRRTEIKYWKTRNNQEIDFIVKDAALFNAYEAKFSGKKSNSFRAFSNSYPEALHFTVCFSNVNKEKGQIYGWEV